MTLNIPDKVYKLVILLGLILIGYSEYKSNRNEKLDTVKQEKYFVYQDSLMVSTLKSNSNLNKKDSLFTIIVSINNNRKELIVNKKLKALWEIHSNNEFNIKLLREKLRVLKFEMDSEDKIRESHYKINKTLMDLGVIFFLIGLFMWNVDEFLNDRKLIEKQNEKVYKNCQSCGKKFSSIRNYGLNYDKSFNYSFCKECFIDGEFTNSNLTKEDFFNQVNETLKTKSWLKRKLVLNSLYFLERWKEEEY
jgi:hypothetical protein